MFEGLIKIVLKSALENPEIKEKIKNLKIKKEENEKNKIIDLDETDYRVMEE